MPWQQKIFEISIATLFAIEKEIVERRENAVVLFVAAFFDEIRFVCGDVVCVEATHTIFEYQLLVHLVYSLEVLEV